MKHLLSTLLLLLAFANPLWAQDRPDFLVSSEWLEEHIDDDTLTVLEMRYYPHRYFTIGHIPGAVQVARFMDLGDNSGQGTLMKFPTREAFQATLRRWGVNDDSTLVLYDDSATALASRLYFLLTLYGFDMDQVKILDGGTVAWQGFNDLTLEEPSPAPGTVTLSDANSDLFVDWTDVYRNVVARRDPQFTLIDARPHDGYTGETLTHAVRAGHIPGAISIVSLDGITKDGEQLWLPMDEIAALYADVPKDQTIYVYCHDGFRMSLAFLQLTALGYEDVRLYNGGWGHWGNKFSLPVVLGDAPFDEAFSL